jgi:hypothetical protein
MTPTLCLNNKTRIAYCHDCGFLIIFPFVTHVVVRHHHGSFSFILCQNLFVPVGTTNPECLKELLMNTPHFIVSLELFEMKKGIMGLTNQTKNKYIYLFILFIIYYLLFFDTTRLLMDYADI